MLAMRRPSQSESLRHLSTLGSRLENALELRQGTFAHRDPRAIARSLRAWAEQRSHNPALAFRSAMSLLVFYAARMARDSSKEQRAKLEAAKVELRALYNGVLPTAFQ